MADELIRVPGHLACAEARKKRLARLLVRFAYALDFQVLESSDKSSPDDNDSVPSHDDVASARREFAKFRDRKVELEYQLEQMGLKVNRR